MASRADSVVKMVGRRKMMMREVRRMVVFTRVERLRRPRSLEKSGPNTEGEENEVTSETICLGSESDVQQKVMQAFRRMMAVNGMKA